MLFNIPISIQTLLFHNLAGANLILYLFTEVELTERDIPVRNLSVRGISIGPGFSFRLRGPIVVFSVFFFAVAWLSTIAYIVFPSLQVVFFEKALWLSTLLATFLAVMPFIKFAILYAAFRFLA